MFTRSPGARGMELRVPPPVVALLTAVAMWRLAGAPSWRAVPPASRLVPAVLLAAAGLAFAAAAIRAFWRVRTTIHPTVPHETTALVVGGVNRITRNPMYVGLLTVLAGWGVWLGAWWPWAVWPLAWGWLHWWQVRPEERQLAATFGEAYAHYRRTVPRWLLIRDG